MMVTETELREALHELADTADDVRGLVGTPRRNRPPRPSRWLIPCAAAVVLVLLIAFAAVRLAGTRDDDSLPAGPPNTGQWDFVLKVDPPAGETIDWRGISVNGQSVGLQRPPGQASCTVFLFGPRATKASTEVVHPQHVQVNGQPALYGRLKKPLYTEDDQQYVVWQPTRKAWAAASCWSTAADAVAVAAGTSLGFYPLRVPFKARSLPSGLRPVDMSSPVQSSGEPRIDVKVASASYDPDRTPDPTPNAWSADIILGHTTEAPGMGRTGSVTVPNAVPGHAVWCNAKRGQVGVDLGKYSLFISGPTSCSKLVPIAKSLDLATNAADQSTWFTTSEAFSS